MSQNESMFPGEDGAPQVAAYPQLTPGMTHAMTATEVLASRPSLYTPPERCQTRKAVHDSIAAQTYWDSCPVQPTRGPWAGVSRPELDAKGFRGLTTDAAERKRLQLWTFLMNYFPDAFLAVLDVSIKGNDQHNPGQDLHWAREKSKDQMNTAFRHMWDYGRGVRKDTDGCYHLAKAIWRLSAELQLNIEAAQAAGVDR